MNTTDKIIAELSDRGGFDGWWDSIDSDIQDEIKNDLRKIVAEERRQGWRDAQIRLETDRDSNPSTQAALGIASSHLWSIWQKEAP